MSGVGHAKMLLVGKGKAAATLLALAALAALSACSGGNLLGTQPEPPPAATPAPPPAPTPTPPPVDLAGRWQFSAASAGSCFMTFADAASTPAQEESAPQGTIAPEGGCPGNFFTSRRWTFEHGALIIRDHKGEPLAQFAVGGDRLDGQATNGTQVSLSR
jgi:hypothetical protein